MEGPRVDVGECRCPGATHPSDWVELWPSVPIAVGASVMAAIRESGDDETVLQGQLARIYVTLGVRAWSFVDADGRGIPVRPTGSGWADVVAELLPWDRGGAEVANMGDELYSEAILRPLMSRSSTRSPGGRTAGSTSPTRRSGTRRRKPPARSSRTPTAGSPSGVPVP